jgi:hypothetical protein
MAKGVSNGECGMLPDRTTFREEVREVEGKLTEQVCSHRERAGARRKAIEALFLRHGSFEEMAVVSTTLKTETVTN